VLIADMTVSIWSALAGVALGLMLLSAAWCDVTTRRIPNRIVTLGSVAALVWAISPAGPGLLMSLLGGVVALITFLALHWLGWMGAGDVKLAGAAGLYFTPSQAFNLCLTIFITGGLIALLWRWQAREGLKERIPYGLAIGLGVGWHAWRHTGF
jgi:Flp pilus assembly protein protease CpaA